MIPPGTLIRGGRSGTASVLATLLLFHLAGCRAGEPVAPAQLPDKVRIAILPYLSYSPLFLADEYGYFRDEGIEIELVRMALSDWMIAMTRGDVDAAAGPTSPALFNSIIRGERMAIVADKGSMPDRGCGTDVFAIRSDLDPENVDPRELRYSRERGALFRYFLERFAASRGMTTEEMTLVDTGRTPETEALRARSVDVEITTEPFATLMEDAGFGRRWIDLREIVPGLQLAVIVYGERLLEDRDLGQRFMNAYLRGVRAYVDGKSEEDLEIIAEFTGADTDVLTRACWPTIRPDGSIRTEGLDEFIDWCVRNGMIDRSIRSDEYWEPYFVENAGAH